MQERLPTMGRLRSLKILGSRTPEQEMLAATSKFESVFRTKIKAAARIDLRQPAFEAGDISMKLTRTPTGSILFIKGKVEGEMENTAIVIDHTGNVMDYLNATDKDGSRVWSKLERSKETASEIQKYAKILKGAEIKPVLGNEVTLAGDVRAIFEALSPTQ